MSRCRSSTCGSSDRCLAEGIGIAVKIAQHKRYGVNLAPLRDQSLIRFRVLAALARGKIRETDLRIGGLLRREDPRQLVNALIGDFDHTEMDLFPGAKAADLGL